MALIVDIVTRLGKGSPLSFKEVDGNIVNLKNAILTLSTTLASSGNDGLLTSSDKSKLDSIEYGATKYVHPTSNGNKHLPAIGVTDTNKVLKALSPDGSAIWSELSWTDIQNKPTFGSGSTYNVPVSGDAGANQLVLGNDSRLAYIANLANNTITISNVVNLQSALDILTNTITSNKSLADSTFTNINAQLVLLNGLSSQFDTVKTGFNSLTQTVNTLSTSVSTFAGDLDVINTTISTIQSDITDLKTSGGSGTGDVMYERTTGTGVTVGGLTAGSILSGTTIQDVLDKILYPYVKPSFGSFSVPSSIQTNALGTTVQGTYTFTWSCNPSANVATNTISIIDLTGSKSLASGIPNSGSYQVSIGPITYSTAATHTFRITAIDVNGTTISRDVSIKWSPTLYYGESSLNTLTESDVKSLRVNDQSGVVAKTYAFNAGGYKWLCYPTSMGLRTTFKDASNNFDVSMNPVVTLTVNGSSYYCHRTYNTLGGSINIIVS